jgi:intracellular sulfur oxidation DsrE/DsrF family protein
MKQNNTSDASPRRKFLQTIATGATALGLATVLPAFQQVQAGTSRLFNENDPTPDEWFRKLNGKHKMVFDVTGPHEIFPFVWPKVFMLSNAATGTPEKECNAVSDIVWAKYKFGEFFKINDPKTKQPAVRNPFWNPGPDDFKIPGMGSVAIGINNLQESGVSFCVCNMAMTVNSTVIAGMMNMDAEAVKKDWTDNVLPGIAMMPSGVWAVGRAQEHGCAYCFVG